MAVKITKFPTLVERETITTLGQFKKLYDNQQYAVLGLHEFIKNQYENAKDISYISHPIPSRVSDFYGDFVAGDIERMVIKASDDTAQELVDSIVYENDLKEMIGDIATTQSIGGYTFIYVWLDENDVTHVDEVPPDQVFPQSDGTYIFGTYKLDPDDKEGKRVLLYTQHFQLQANGDLLIEREAFTCDENGVTKDRYPLEKMSLIVGYTIVPSSTIDGIGDYPIRQIKNGGKSSKQGKSDYCDIIPNIAEVNERTTHISTVLLKNLDAKMQLPSSMAEVGEEGGDPKVKAFDYILVESKDQPEAKYITNGNPLLADAREQIMQELKMIETATGVPMWVLTKGTSPEKVESLKIQLFSAIRKTDRKRSKIKRALNDIFRIAFVLNGSELTDDLIIKFSDVLPTDELVETQIESEKTRGGLSSKRSAIMRLEGCSAEDAEAEMAQIDSENRLTGLNPTPPTL